MKFSINQNIGKHLEELLKTHKKTNQLNHNYKKLHKNVNVNLRKTIANPSKIKRNRVNRRKKIIKPIIHIKY